jgi:hypothetical protein
MKRGGLETRRVVQSPARSWRFSGDCVHVRRGFRGKTRVLRQGSGRAAHSGRRHIGTVETLRGSADAVIHLQECEPDYLVGSTESGEICAVRHRTVRYTQDHEH